MNILLCIDYSSFTEKMLATVQVTISSIVDRSLNIVHVTDEQMFYATSGYETALGEKLMEESKELRQLCEQHFGQSINFIEMNGIPKLKIGELLEANKFDLVIVGSHSAHNLGDRLLGSFAENILRISKIPVLIIP